MNLDNKYLKAWLAFNKSPTEDVLLNQWTTYGNPTIGTANAFNGNALQLDGQSYIKLSGIELGGKDFYIDGWVYVDSSSPANARVISIVNPSNGNHLVSVRKNSSNANRLDFWSNGYADVSQNSGQTNVPAVTSVGQRVHFKLIYRYTDKIFALCINDKTYVHRTSAPQYSRRSFDIYIGALPNGNQGFIGSIDELRIYDGTWFSYGGSNNLPTLDEYQQIEFTADVSRKVNNVFNVEFTADVERKVINAWRYVNLGTATTLTVTGTTLENLSEDKSVTGTAFYQTAQAKCFDLPTTDEVWLKFDVYFNGSQRWRAYNGGANGNSGITAQTNSGLSFFGNGNHVDGFSGTNGFSNVCKSNQLQTVLLHMISGTSAGVIEAWVDGAKIYTYTGDVNHGEEFADIYLQSDGAGTFFSNVVISNKELTFGDGYQTFTADVERKLGNRIEVTFDVLRLLNPEILANEFISGLKIWLPFDESPTFDKCWNSWTASETATIGETGTVSGKALNFNGRGYVVMTEPIKFDGYTPFSVSCWFSGTEAARQGNLWYMRSSDARTDIFVDVDETLRLGVDGSSFRTVATSENVLDGNNHYVVVNCYGRNFALFLDGSYIGSTGNISIPTERKYRLYVGERGTTSDPKYGFKMAIDEFVFHYGVIRPSSPPTKAEYDFYKTLTIRSSFYFDVERQVFNSINVEFSADVKILDVVPVEFTTDIEVCDFVSTNLTADVAIFDMIRVEFAADVMRSIIGKVKLYAGDNSAYFEENPAGGELTPVVIPSQSLTDIGLSPAAPNNTNGLQSVEISIAEQQITENVHFVGVVPFDIMYPVRGQYLDYLIDMRVERVQKHGILYSCDCCSDIDEILFTQLAYTIPENTPWPSDEEKPADQDNEDSEGGEDTDGNTDNTSNTDGDNKEEKIYPLASAHAMYLAAILGRTPVIQFKDFNSTVLANESGGVTYADLIREIFYWTSRIPTMLINVFIRGDKIYFVQRGYEARLIDLTGTKHTIPTVTHDLVRMTWGSTLWSKTETREYAPLETSTDDDNYSSDDDDDDDSWTNIGKVVTSDNDGETYTTYHYTTEGVLIKTVVVYTSFRDRKESYRKSIVNDYADGLLRAVTTKTRFPGDAHESDSTIVTTYGYLTLPDKTKFLATEMTVEYDYKGKVVNRRVTSKSPTGHGQGTAHDNEGNEDTGRTSGDDRVSPYQRQQASKTAKAFEEEKNADKDTQKESRTVNGLSLYDSSFPVHGDDKLIEITEAIKWLNRRTKETVTMTIYEYPHLIDFNDRIIFEGNVYFLVNNTATTTERIFNEQRITMTRWY